MATKQNREESYKSLLTTMRRTSAARSCFCCNCGSVIFESRCTVQTHNRARTHKSCQQIESTFGKAGICIATVLAHSGPPSTNWPILLVVSTGPPREGNPRAGSKPETLMRVRVCGPGSCGGFAMKHACHPAEVAAVTPCS